MLGLRGGEFHREDSFDVVVNLFGGCGFGVWVLVTLGLVFELWRGLHVVLLDELFCIGNCLSVNSCRVQVGCRVRSAFLEAAECLVVVLLIQNA